MSKKVTAEQLTRMVQRGFEEISKQFGNVATKNDVQEVRNIIQLLRDEMYGELAEIKTTLGPLARSVAEIELDYISLKTRVDRLEKKVGIK